VARRKPLDFEPAMAPYSIAETKNIDAVLFAPVIRGYWKQAELKDGTYTYLDLLDIIEMIQVENENNRRDYEQARRDNK
jgi:hypothetical protein